MIENDAISREELLKAIDTWDKFGYTETGCFVREPKGDYVPYIHYDDVIKSIKGMPSVTQKSAKDYLDMADRKAKKIKDALTDNPQKSGKWVPVSKRLPEDGQRVLVTQTVSERTVVYCTTFPFEKIKEKYIIAWMPLPQPYKAESEEQTDAT